MTRPRPPFDSGLLLEPAGGKFWSLARDLVYLGARERFTIPAGFRTDLASVPRVFWSVLPPFGDYAPAAVLHDALCRDPDISYADADGMLWRVTGQLVDDHGRPLIPAWQRQALYRGVQVGHTLGLGPPRPAVSVGRVPLLSVEIRHPDRASWPDDPTTHPT